MLDSPNRHRAAGVRGAIKARGAQFVDLPPDSANLNRIEQVFAKLNHLSRKASASTVDALHDTVASLRDALSPAECRNEISNSGYSSQT